jgi:hypothetical protein
MARVNEKVKTSSHFCFGLCNSNGKLALNICNLVIFDRCVRVRQKVDSDLLGWTSLEQLLADVSLPRNFENGF